MAAMDERLAALNQAVATAADAHLTDPLDVTVYGRLVGAVVERRGYLAAPLPLTTGDGAPLSTFPTLGPSAGAINGSVADLTAEDPDSDDGPAADVALPSPLELGGDPREVLARLRGL